MRLLARRTGRGPNWRDECPLEDRAAAFGVTLKEAARGKESADMRANRKTVMAKGDAYLTTRPVPPPRPAHPPPDTPEAMRVAAERALAFQRLTREFALGTCVACRETRLNAPYSKGRGGEKIFLMCSSYKKGGFTEKNNAPPTWIDAERQTRYDFPGALTALAISEKILIARLSVTAAIHHLAHVGVASTGHVSKFPKPADSIAADPPRLPPDVTIVRVRHGAANGDAKKKNRFYAVRRKKAMGAPHWLKGEIVTKKT